MDVEREEELRRLEQALGHRFADADLLDRALTHTSHAHQDLEGHTRHNEPLEFLGDSVLGLIVADLLHRRDPDGPEGGRARPGAPGGRAEPGPARRGAGAARAAAAGPRRGEDGRPEEGQPLGERV